MKPWLFPAAAIAFLTLASQNAVAKIICVEEAGGVCLKFKNVEETPAPAPSLSPEARVERQLGLSAAQRRDVQIALRTIGVYAGAIDGAIGPASRTAIRRWQQARGDRVTGFLTAAQHDYLSALATDIRAAGGGSASGAAPTSSGGVPDAGRVYEKSWNEQVVVNHASGIYSEGKMTARLRRISDSQAELTLTFDSANLPSSSFESDCTLPVGVAGSCLIRGKLGASIQVSGNLPQLRIGKKDVSFW